MKTILTTALITLLATSAYASEVKLPDNTQHATKGSLKEAKSAQGQYGDDYWVKDDKADK